ncbi:hypothetical protein [Escherichia coli]|uniref:hypothetical protein n=1 Tax=Escherichia coli TaxID=562 RepID=UPI00201AB514|nr:hypothetical protein [Escherichia coli]
MNITDKELSSNTVSQYGWNLGEFNHSTPFTSHFIYITDYHKDNTWMISLSQEDFNTTKISTSLSLDSKCNFVHLQYISILQEAL